jgi:succinyl-CoA synthetase beta subunit
VNVPVPIVARLAGTNVELGRRILKESGLRIVAADSLADAADKAVAALGGARASTRELEAVS